jgi:hypothetical protein
MTREVERHILDAGQFSVPLVSKLPVREVTVKIKKHDLYVPQYVKSDFDSSVKAYSGIVGVPMMSCVYDGQVFFFPLPHTRYTVRVLCGDE